MNLSPPPAHADKQKTPVVEEFRRLAFERVPDELKNPSDQEQSEPVQPKSVEEDAGSKDWERQQDGRNAQRMTQPVHRMPMTGAVLRDPLLVGASAQHARDDITGGSALRTQNTRGAGPPKRHAANRAYNSPMYHYNPSTALEELTEEATLPNPVHVRDMMLRRKLSADEALELNRIFLEYQKFFGETQKLGKDILRRLAA